MWVELHTTPPGIYLIDRRTAFYPTPVDLIPVVVEVDPSLAWRKDLFHADQSDYYTTDRLKMTSFPTLMQIRLAGRFGLDFHQRDVSPEVSALLKNINLGMTVIHFSVPGDPLQYTWVLNKGIRVIFVNTGVLDSGQDQTIYTTDGMNWRVFEQDGTLIYIITTSNLDQMKESDLVIPLLAPMFEVLLSRNGRLPAEIPIFYDGDPTKVNAALYALQAGPVEVKNGHTESYFYLVGR